jgi:hypothetical protein
LHAAQPVENEKNSKLHGLRRTGKTIIWELQDFFTSGGKAVRTAPSLTRGLLRRDGLKLVGSHPPKKVV